jgi:hypothetical protein
MTYNIIDIDLSTPRINQVYNLYGDSIKVINATSDCFIQFDNTAQDPINLLLVDEIKIKFKKFYISNVAIENKHIKIIVSENFSLRDRISIPDYIPETIPITEPIPDPTPAPATNFITPQIINITNSEPNVQIELDLSHLNFNNINPDGSNIRITDENYIPLPFYLIDLNKTANTGKLFFKTPNKIINRAFIFNINLEAKSVSNSDATFEFFDDFKGTAIDSTKWNIQNTIGWSVVNGELRGSNTAGLLLSHLLFSDGIILEIKLRTTATATNGQTLGGFWGSTTDGFSLLQFPEANDNIKIDTTLLPIGDVVSERNINILLQFITQPTTVNLKITQLDTNVINYDVVHTNTVINEHIIMGRRGDLLHPLQTYETFWDWVRVRKVTAATAVIV